MLCCAEQRSLPEAASLKRSSELANEILTEALGQAGFCQPLLSVREGDARQWKMTQCRRAPATSRPGLVSTSCLHRLLLLSPTQQAFPGRSYFRQSSCAQSTRSPPTSSAFRGDFSVVPSHLWGYSDHTLYSGAGLDRLQQKYGGAHLVCLHSNIADSEKQPSMSHAGIDKKIRATRLSGFSFE